MKLNENQLLFLAFLLNEKGIKNKETQGELLDHLATNIECKMDNQQLFHEALDDAIAEFGEENFLAIQNNQQYLFQQKIKKNMKRAAILLFLLVGAIALVANNQDKSNEKEIATDNGKASPVIVKTYENEPPSVYPVKGDYPVVATFGKRMHPKYKVMKFHNGIDIKAPIGASVVATSDGIIEKVEFKKAGYGKHIVIKHDDTFKSMYAHLSVIDVEVGDKVKAGDKIGEVGSSGTSINPHLHYEVIKEGKKVNPEDYVSL